MPRSGSVLLASLLWLSHCSRSLCAVEPLRAPADPFFVSPPGSIPDDNVPQTSNEFADLEFTLRHIYHRGAYDHPHLHRYIDIPPNAATVTGDGVNEARISVPTVLRARARPRNVQRMADRSRQAVDGLLDHASMYGEAAILPASAWSVDRIEGPDVRNKSTLISLAWMAANAYTEEPHTGDWQDVGGGFNNTDDFGWEEDGLRGHIFATKDNSTIVIGLKGTTMAYFDGAETTSNDKTNDNLFASCCCAQGGDWGWKKVCDCMSETYTCNNTCLVKQLRRKSRYYSAARDLFHNVTERYPNSQVWMSGHSLGGVVSALLGLTYGLPVVTFEAYPDALAASRIGLPVPPGYTIGAHQARTDVAIHHFGHTADPVFVGACHGLTSPCSIFGYAFESACHTGKKCTYDTVNDKKWGVHIINHRILSVIHDVLEGYDDVANCTEYLDCTDCYLWKFFESNGTETTTRASTTTTSSYIRTRTETCKTPGWWGCLDETTTSPVTTTTSTTTTTSCATPGWFGCKDVTTTTLTSTKTVPATRPAITTETTMPTSTTSTCKDPGFFWGCYDPTTTTTLPPTTSPPTTAPPTSQPTQSATSSESCSTPFFFGWFCLDHATATSTVTPTSTPTPSPTQLPTTRRKMCVARHWYGLCKEWRWEPVDTKSDL